MTFNKIELHGVFLYFNLDCLLLPCLICDFSLYFQCSDSKEWKADVLCLKEV